MTITKWRTKENEKGKGIENCSKGRRKKDHEKIIVLPQEREKPEKENKREGKERKKERGERGEREKLEELVKLVTVKKK